MPGIDIEPANGLLVSMTSTRERIMRAALAIESLMQQSVLPGRIVLCLDKNSFRKGELPALIRRQCERGLKVLLCERDLGPHTKYYYSLQQNPDSLLLTVDDDKLYPATMIEELLQAHLRAPDVVHCHRGHAITFSGRSIQPYKRWEKNTAITQASALVFPTGVGGVLYFPGCFDERVLDQSLFGRLCPSADDVWLKAMTLAKGTLSQMVPHEDDWNARCFTVPGTQHAALKRINKSRRTGNDSQIARTFRYFGLMEGLCQQYHRDNNPPVRKEALALLKSMFKRRRVPSR